MIKSQNWSVDLETIERCLELCQQGHKKLTLNQPTGNFFYDAWKIKPELEDTAWAKILSSLPIEIGEARVITLSPGETYMAHSDIDDRYHLNLQGDQSYLIDLDEDIMWPLEKDGMWYVMDAGKTHVASNFGSIDRIQLVVRKLLTRGNLNNPTSITINPASEQHDYRYKFDRVFSPFLNQANKNQMLDNFMFKDQTVSFDIDSSMLDNFKLLVTEDFAVSYD